MTTKGKKIYVVQHSHVDGDGCDETKFIGVYATKLKAAAAVEIARDLPRFKSHKSGFTIDAHNLDESKWVEGFVSVPTPRMQRK